MLNRIQLSRIQRARRECLDILAAVGMIGRRTRYSEAREMAFRFADGQELTFDQLVTRRLARTAMG